MAVSVGDDVAPGEPAAQPLVPPEPRAAVVHEPDAETFRLDDEALRKLTAELVLVHVPVHGVDRRERTQLGEDRGCREVADVQDPIRRREKPDARLGKAAASARKVRIAEERDQKRPSTNCPSR